MIPHLHTFKWKLEQVCYSCGLYFCVSMLLLRDNCFACRVNSRQLIFFRIVDILINGDLSQWEYFDNVKRVIFFYRIRNYIWLIKLHSNYILSSSSFFEEKDYEIAIYLCSSLLLGDIILNKLQILIWGMWTYIILIHRYTPTRYATKFISDIYVIA